MSIIIEADIIPWVNHNNKSCTWYFTINKEHNFEIYRDRNLTLWKKYTDVSFAEENRNIIESIIQSKELQNKLSKSTKKLFITKILCKNCNPNDYINIRKQQLESDSDNIWRFEFILL